MSTQPTPPSAADHSAITAPGPLHLRMASPDDGALLHAIIRDAGGLDVNSPYCYHLLARHTGDTCIIAERAGDALGCVTGYRLPNNPGTLFVWQVAVLATARGQGIGQTMLVTLAQSLMAAGLQAVQATVAPENTASRRMFAALARHLDAAIDYSPWLHPQDFPEPGHAAEELLQIGPLSGAAATSPQHLNQ